MSSECGEHPDEAQLSLDPYDDLGLESARALEEWIFSLRDEEMLTALDFLGDLVARWDDCGVANGPGSWVSAVREDHDDNGGIPVVILKALATELSTRDMSDRVRTIEAVRQLQSDWLACAVDDEKLVGHLILAHGKDVADASRSSADTAHAEAHLSRWAQSEH